MTRLYLGLFDCKHIRGISAEWAKDNVPLSESALSRCSRRYPLLPLRWHEYLMLEGAHFQPKPVFFTQQRRRVLRSYLDCLVNILRLNDEETSKLFLRLNERSIRDRRTPPLWPYGFSKAFVHEPGFRYHLSSRVHRGAMGRTLG